MANEIIVERRNQAVVIVFNRPEAGNRFNLEMSNQLFQALKPITTAGGTRAVMLCGQGGSFVNGLDLDMFQGDFTAALTVVNQMMQTYHSSIRELNGMDKPVLAAVDGRVAGPGLSLMLAADLVIAAKGTIFNAGFATYGLSPDGGASFNLARKVGLSKANELLMLSQDFTADEALSWGLINAVVDDDQLQPQALAWLDRLANGPTRAYAGIKRVLAKAFDQDLITHLSLEHTYWGASARSFDFRDAVKAHLAKRDVKFTGA